MTCVIVSIVLFRHSYFEIEKTLACLLSSPFVCKVILVDNDESDWAFKFQHEKVVYLKSDGNFGFGYGHNFAINRYVSNSDLFLICNPDIMFEESEFAQLVNFVKDRKEGLFLPKIVYANGENQFGARLLPTPLNLFARRFSKKLAIGLDQQYLLKNYTIQKPIFAPYLSGCFMLFRSEALETLKGFDERFFMYMEDIDISRRCAQQFGTLYCPQFSVVHAHEQASYKSIKLLKAHIQSAILYFNKWGWLYDSNRKLLNDKCIRGLSL
ncbi:glycosyltransferase [Acinetobacter sp. WZC-1]|uniref:glycosyltransferase n=1 Tax=Acinetobacter sp. WZC-1 TaxID=3459034 RepID=UPI00403D732A